ncbi:chemoreceptor glutamine deamidase CheD [Methyloraptor flagellatus]|jgi:chemotaxis protein CheD|uniref:Probable chemoreceptor glutamine deamidase CheD n=1 Tax=Methyloraptor flagellatus TaxID=3162530 RepID=A0AAU7XAS5_9HYPH
MSLATARPRHLIGGSPDHRSKRAARVYMPGEDAYGIRVLPGDYYTTDAEDEVIVTILGSCVAACVRDPRTGFGGMNHFMLPESESGHWSGVSAAMRYGNHAMETLINAVLTTGCRREDLEIKLFGGADLNEGPMVGTMNARFALKYLEIEGLWPDAVDLGGNLARRIHYRPANGKVQRLFLKPMNVKTVVAEESRYISTISHAPQEGAIELFD